MNDLTEIPAVIGDYAVLAELARGDASVVLRARQNSLDRIVALKVVRSEWVSDPTDLERFLRGAKSAARLDHPQIVRIFDVGRVEDLHYYAMALVEGQSLSQRVASQGPLAVREAVELVRRVAQATAYTHSQKIVHRGLSPDCVLLTSDSKPRVTGFGLARPTATGHSVTADGVRVDSFTAPEVVTGTGSSNSPASDIYGLGGILYFALTGKPLHADASVAELVSQIAESPVVSPRKLNPKVPGSVEAICLRCLAKAPGDRYATAEAVADALLGLLGTKPKVAATGTTAPSQGVGKRRSTETADLDTRPNAQERTRRRKRAPARTAKRHGLLWAAIGLSILVTLAGIGIAFRPSPTPRPVTPATGIPTAESTPASVAGSGSASSAPPQGTAPQAEWKPLFNGKDLTGWKPLGYNGWRVENEVLIGESEKNSGWLMTDTEFSDYELEFEYKLAPNGNSGVYLDARPLWNGSGKDFAEIQLLDDDSPTFGNVLANQRNLSWWKKAAPKLPTPTPVGNWYKVRVTVSGSNRVQIALNDQLILDHTDVLAPKGHIGLSLYPEGGPTRIEFRNIRVKSASVPVTKGVTAVEPEWKPLFNGKDLTGWKPLGHNGWRVENEVLIGESSSGALGWLMSDAEFTDYELDFQYKLAANSNSGIFPRAWPEGNVTGKEFAEIQLLDDDAPPFRNLATNQRNLSWWSRAAPKASPQAPAGMWHPVRLTVTGNRIQIALNEQQILDHTDALPPKGHIGLQLYPTRVEFRNLRVRPHLNSSDPAIDPVAK